MEIDAPNDIPFLQSLVTFHEARDKAMALPAPSDLLLSLRSYSGGVVALYLFAEVERINTAEDLYRLIQDNGVRARLLTKNVEKIANREHLWRSPKVIEKNKRKVLAMYNEAITLRNEAERAFLALEIAGDG